MKSLEPINIFYFKMSDVKDRNIKSVCQLYNLLKEKLRKSIS